MSDEFTSRGTPLDNAGMAKALDVLHVGAAELWPVLSVETSGIGFFADRRPKILYERHVFSRLTDRKFDAEHSDISSPTPGNYGPTGAHQYDRLNAAMALNREAALQSTSWRLGQVMGFNFKQTGSASVDDMVKRMTVSEGNNSCVPRANWTAQQWPPCVQKTGPTSPESITAAISLSTIMTSV